MSKTIIAPVPNLNGTTIKKLIDQRQDIRRQLAKVLSALASATPHGRDFQTVDYGVYEQAISQHKERVRVILELSDDIYTEMVMIIGG